MHVESLEAIYETIFGQLVMLNHFITFLKITYDLSKSVRFYFSSARLDFIENNVAIILDSKIFRVSLPKSTFVANKL